MQCRYGCIGSCIKKNLTQKSKKALNIRYLGFFRYKNSWLIGIYLKIYWVILGSIRIGFLRVIQFLLIICSLRNWIILKNPITG